MDDALKKIIIKLANGDICDQMKAYRDIIKNQFFPHGYLKEGIDVSVIPELLPVIVKFMKSEYHYLQQGAALLISAIACTHDQQQNTKLAIDADVVPKLVGHLSSTDSLVVEQSLDCLSKIAYHYPQEVIENKILCPITKCLQSEIHSVSNHALILLNILTTDENFIRTIGNETIIPLLDLLKSNNEHTCIESLDCVITIATFDSEMCQRLHENSLLPSLKLLFDQLFIDITVVKGKKLSKQHEKILLKLFTVLQKIISYGNEYAEMIIDNNLMPAIMKHIYGTVSTCKIKAEAIQFINKLIAIKDNLLSTLINDYNYILLLYNNLLSRTDVLLIAVLTVLNDIIETFQDKEVCRQKLKDCRDPWKLKNLFGHNNKDIRKLAKSVGLFIDPEVRFPDDVESELNEQNNDEVVEAPHARRKRQRSLRTEGSGVDSNQNNSSSCESPGHFNNALNDDEIPSIPPQNQNVFEPVKYWPPHESYIAKYCQMLELQYVDERFVPKIKISQITSTSRPDECLTPKDNNGFSIFSILFTGDEKSSVKICNNINEKFTTDMIQKGKFDSKKVSEICGSQTLRNEHLEKIVEWLGCRIMVYCNERWESFGNKENNDERIPIFVFEKTENNYHIILRLKEN